MAGVMMMSFGWAMERGVSDVDVHVHGAWDEEWIKGVVDDDDLLCYQGGEKSLFDGRCKWINEMKKSRTLDSLVYFGACERRYPREKTIFVLNQMKGVVLAMSTHLARY